MTTVFVCQDSFDGILCGVYDAWMSRQGHENVRLDTEGHGNMELFCEYRSVEITEEKLMKVITSIRKKISEQVYQHVFKASLSKEEDRADKIYRFLIYGFHYGKAVIDMLQIPAVFDLFQMCRFVGNEEHLLTGFVRFSQMEKGILLGKIMPKNDVLVLLAPHFADRLSGENWILYDENRKKAAVHMADSGWVMVSVNSKEWEDRLAQQTDEEEYRRLWSSFYHSISIKERENPVCQRNHLPLRYRPFMTEFQSTGD